MESLTILSLVASFVALGVCAIQNGILKADIALLSKRLNNVYTGKDEMCADIRGTKHEIRLYREEVERLKKSEDLNVVHLQKIDDVLKRHLSYSCGYKYERVKK